METLELLKTDHETLRRSLQSLDLKSELKFADGACFWIGSVAMEPSERLSTFLHLAESENLKDLSGFNEMSEKMAYAVIIQDSKSSSSFHLFILESQNNPDVASRILFGKKLSKEHQVIPKEEKNLAVNVKAVWKEAVKETFFGKR